MNKRLFTDNDTWYHMRPSSLLMSDPSRIVAFLRSRDSHIQ
jgi:hypothetical protein